MLLYNAVSCTNRVLFLEVVIYAGKVTYKPAPIFNRLKAVIQSLIQSGLMTGIQRCGTYCDDMHVGTKI